MLVGEVPGRWPTEDAVRAGRFLEASAAHRTRLTTSGTTIEGALVRGLAIRQDQRTASPAALLDELRGVRTKRRYGADEAVEIVKRAAELEATNPTGTGAMTIGGVEALGAEVGIAPELVRSAARALSDRTAPPGTMSTPLTPPTTNQLAGGPTRILYERTVQGELPESEFSYVVDEIRRAMGNAGQVNQLGRSFSWTIGRTAVRRDLEVSVSVRAGRTRITVSENLSQLVGVVYGSIGGGLGGGGMGMIFPVIAGFLHAPGAVVVAIPAWLLLTFGIARTTYSYASRRRDRELAQLADHLAAVVEEAIGPVHRLPGASSSTSR